MKKIVSIGLTAMLVMANVGTAFADDNILNNKITGNVSIVAADTVDENVIKQFENGVKSVIIQEDGTEIPVDVMVTITELPQPYHARQNANEKQYKITATMSETKIKSDSSDWNTNEVVASQTLTMTWTDVPGNKNTIDNLSGSISVLKGTQDSSVVSWGQGSGSQGGSENVGTAFDLDIDFTSSALLGTVESDLVTYFKNVSGGIRTEIMPTVFD